MFPESSCSELLALFPAVSRTPRKWVNAASESSRSNLDLPRDARPKEMVYSMLESFVSLKHVGHHSFSDPPHTRSASVSCEIATRDSSARIGSEMHRNSLDFF